MEVFTRRDAWFLTAGFLLCLTTFHVFNGWSVWSTRVVPIYCRFPPEEIPSLPAESELRAGSLQKENTTPKPMDIYIITNISSKSEDEPVDVLAESVQSLDEKEEARLQELTSTPRSDYFDSENSTVSSDIQMDYDSNEALSPENPSLNAIRIAIGLTTTSKKTSDITSTNIRSELVFFKTLLPSFCKTCSVGDKYLYTFYITYDSDDDFFSQESKLYLFEAAFKSMVASMCGKWKHQYVFLKLLAVPYTAKPAWAQNDAMIEAYLDDNDYYYRLNDDVTIASSNWTEVFIEALAKYNPPNVGMISPNHTGQHSDHFEFDFVHSTHIDMFGYYYPRVFLDLYADEWIANVYVRNVRAKKISNQHLIHTQAKGKRYDEKKKEGGARRRIYRNGEKMRGQFFIQRYIKYFQSQNDKMDRVSKNKVEGVRIIAMSLAGQNIDDTLGAIWNVNLAKILFPGWKVRLYMSSPQMDDHNAVPQKIIRKLLKQGAELVQISPEMAATVPHQLWKYLALDDQGVDFALFRDPSSRLNEVDTHIVSEFDKIKTKDAVTVFYRSSQRAIDNQMGMRAKRVRLRLSKKGVGALGNETLMFVRRAWQSKDFSSPTEITKQFLLQVIWPAIEGSTKGFGGVVLNNEVPAVKRLGPALRRFYNIGRKFDAFDTFPGFLRRQAVFEMRKQKPRKHIKH